MRSHIFLLALVASYFDRLSLVYSRKLKDQGNIQEVSINQDQLPHVTVSSQFSISDLQNLLFTEVDDEIEAVKETLMSNRGLSNKRERELKSEAPLPEAEAIFDHIVEHAWQLSKSQMKGDHASRFLTQSSNDGEMQFAYLVCSRTPLLQSGIQRLAPMLQFTGAQLNDAIVVSNDEKQSCYHISTSFSKASIVDSTLSNDEYVIVPMAGK